jgi:hypothetical protein
MADMFGAPIGIGAAEQDMRQNVLGGLAATKMLGEIEAQPTHLRYLKAQTELEEAKVRDAQVMQNLATNFQASEAAAAKGEILTVANAPAKKKAPGQALIDMANLGMSKGVSPVLLTPLWEKGAAIAQHAAAAESSAANTAKTKVETVIKQAERMGASAQAILDAGPKNYGNILAKIASTLSPEQSKALEMLPLDYNSAVPLLKAMVTSTMQVKDKLQLDLNKIKTDAQIARWNNANARGNAQLGVAKAQEKLITKKSELLEKYGGKNLQSTIDQKRAATRSKEAVTEKIDALEFPAAPLNPKDWEIGKSYTAADKSRFTILKDADGKAQIRWLSAPGGLPLKLSGGAKAAASILDDDDDDLDLEGDE